MKVIKEHLGFILTMAITYLLGIIIIIVQYVAALNAASDTSINFMEVLLDSLIPTTITYVLGCVLVNIADLFKDKADDYIFNIFTCMFVMIYALIFSIYVMVGFSFGWVIGELIATAVLLWLNIMCYREKCKHRNHNLA